MQSSVINKTEIMEKDVEELIGKADVIIENTISNIKKEKIVMYFNIGKMVTDYKKENNSKYGESVAHIQLSWNKIDLVK